MQILDRAEEIKLRYNINDMKNRYIIFPKKCLICKEFYSFSYMKQIKHFGYDIDYICLNFYICKKCFNQYMMNKTSKNKPQKEPQMSVVEVLSNEKERLEKQLGEFNSVTLPENVPTHILEHLKMKKSLIENCIKSINDLKNNYALDETIKKLFTT